VFDFIPSRFLFVCLFVFFNSFEREWMDWFIFFSMCVPIPIEFTVQVHF
jgi:hypothetical protein